MDRQLKKRRLIPVAIALVAIIAVSGVAYAYWTGSGGGTGTGHTAAGVTDLTATSAALADMYPGDSPQNIVITVHNPLASGQTVYVTQVAVAVDHTSNGGCGAADFNVTLTPVAVGRQIAAGADLVLDGTASPAITPPQIQFKNDANRSQDLCKSVTVTLAFTIT